MVVDTYYYRFAHVGGSGQVVVSRLMSGGDCAACALRVLSFDGDGTLERITSV